MARVQSTSDPAGSAPYEFPYNPTEYLGQDSQNATFVEILDGAPSWQKKKWDSRPRTLRWYGIGATSTVDGIGRSAMVDYMRPWVGTLRYFNFQDLVRANENWPNASIWKKARVIDLATTLRRGGELRYDRVDLILQPEE